MTLLKRIVRTIRNAWPEELRKKGILAPDIRKLDVYSGVSSSRAFSTNDGSNWQLNGPDNSLSRSELSGSDAALVRTTYLAGENVDMLSIGLVGLGALLGAIVGSFIECARYRAARDIGLIDPAHSYCSSCGTALNAFDLVPILSWLWLCGRCRYCKAPIGILSLLSEIIAASFGAALMIWIVAG